MYPSTGSMTTLGGFAIVVVGTRDVDVTNLYNRRPRSRHRTSMRLVLMGWVQIVVLTSMSCWLQYVVWPIYSWFTPKKQLILVGGLNPSEKYESQSGWLFQYMGKNVPNHKPEEFLYISELRCLSKNTSGHQQIFRMSKPEWWFTRGRFLRSYWSLLQKIPICPD